MVKNGAVIDCVRSLHLTACDGFAGGPVTRRQLVPARGSQAEEKDRTDTRKTQGSLAEPHSKNPTFLNVSISIHRLFTAVAAGLDTEGKCRPRETPLSLPTGKRPELSRIVLRNQH